MRLTNRPGKRLAVCFLDVRKDDGQLPDSDIKRREENERFIQT